MMVEVFSYGGGIQSTAALILKDHVWFTRKLKPLDKATTEYVQLSLLEDEENQICESGYCFI